METPRIDLDWTRMLGFDQASPGPDPFRHSPKIGPKEARGFSSPEATPVKAMVGEKPTGAALQAKIGNKDAIRR